MTKNLIKSAHQYMTAKHYAKPVHSLLSIDLTVDEAIMHIRKTHSADQPVLYLYVLDKEQRLLGVVSTRDLLISFPDTPIRDILHTQVKTIESNQTVHEGLTLMQKHNLLAVPVIEEGAFIGILDIHDYFEEYGKLDSAKKRLEIFQTLGFMLEGEEKKSTLYKYKARVPWMFCNMLGGLACAVISQIFSVVLMKVLVLAMFIPLVLSLSESISMQAMTQTLHEMHRHKSFLKQAFRYILNEAKLFILVALTCGVIVGSLSLLWGDGRIAACTIGSSIVLGILVSAIIGSAIPLLLHAWRLDPKIASGPVVLMIADVITTLIYFLLGFWWLVL